MGRCLIFLMCVSLAFGYAPSQHEVFQSRTKLHSLSQPQCTAIPEGEFVYFFQPAVLPWLQEPLNAERLRQISERLRPYLKIPLTKEGFTMASVRKRENELDTTSYSAIWVRDACWHYYGLKLTSRKNAKRLMLSLLRFYAAQRNRFLSIIENPTLASDFMQLPLVRFSRQTLSHHQIMGEDQCWNHNQYDSHGLFLLALSDAVSDGILSKENLTESDYTTLALFPIYFTAIDYAKRLDVGPWEEVPLYNASSAGLVAAGVRRMMHVFGYDLSFAEAVQRLSQKMPRLRETFNQALAKSNIEYLYTSGMERVEKNLRLGGEAPSIHGYNRRADVALLFLCLVEHTPFYDQPERIKQILDMNRGLVGLYGVNRYQLDAYQGRNYWIEYDVPSNILGPMTKEKEFITRFKKGYMPAQQPLDAQWFFDSNFASLYYHLSEMEEDGYAKSYYLQQGDIHLKRALGQLTGPNMVAANGDKVPQWGLAESINFVQINGQTTPLPSPICPLSWATAALQMALADALKAHTPAGARAGS